MTDVRLTALNPEDSQVYPVACNTSGELKLEKQATFDGNIDGDLTVSGTASFGGDATINSVTVGLGGGSVATNTAVGVNALLENNEGSSNTSVGVNALSKNNSGFTNTSVGSNALLENNSGYANTAVGSNALRENNKGSSNTSVGVNALSKNNEGYSNTAVGLNALRENNEGDFNTSVGQGAGYYIKGDRNTILGAYTGIPADDELSDTVIISAGPTERLRIDSNRVATFQGDVVVSSRGKKWMLVEQGGLCHMVEQVKATTADLVDPAAELDNPAAVTEYPKLRDVFAELNVVEKALEEVMEKLRMTEPDGWPVWDGSDNS